jgi:hypothetical protein
MDRKDLGIFPVSTVTLHTSGGHLVTDLHQQQPSFLVDGGHPPADRVRPRRVRDDAAGATRRQATRPILIARAAADAAITKRTGDSVNVLRARTNAAMRRPPGMEAAMRVRRAWGLACDGVVYG